MTEEQLEILIKYLIKMREENTGSTCRYAAYQNCLDQINIIKDEKNRL